MAFYNQERTHQSLGYRTPDNVYKTGAGGGAMIVDKFGGAGEKSSVALLSTPDFSPARIEAKTAAKEKAKTESTTTSKATSQPGQRRAAACVAESTA